jgi:7-keto-8-aminopelargonate synthetase-like enzyme
MTLNSAKPSKEDIVSTLVDRFNLDLRRLMESGALGGSFADFVQLSGKSLEFRTQGYYEWHRNRMEQGVWPFSTELRSSPGPEATVIDQAGKERTGVNFASQDYLGLALHTGVRAAAIEAIKEYGPHIAGAPVLQGNSTLSSQLQAALAELLGLPHVVLFPTGWAAGYGVISALVRRKDHVVLDRYAHNCCVQGAMASTDNVHRVRHLSTEAFVQRLRRIRATDAENAILVVTEGIFSMDGDSPDLQALQVACREYEATLLVDVAHDLGAVGPGGTGSLGLQGVLGKVDLVIGSFSKVFASNGGFVSTSSAAIREYLRAGAPSRTFSNALSPPQCATVLTSLEIVRSPEGEVLRQNLRDVAQFLREALSANGLQCLGKLGPLVPVFLGPEGVGRITAALCFDSGVFANLVEFPAVSVGASRFRMQVMATHTRAHARLAADVIGRAFRFANHLLDRSTDLSPNASATTGG